MTGKHLYLDIDDVLAETTRAMARLARDRFDKDVAFEEMAVFDLSVSLGLDEEEYPRFMDAVHAHDFLLELRAKEGAAQTVSRWHGAGAEISVVTGRPPETRPATTRWLARAGFSYHRLEFVDKYGRYGDRATLRPRDLVSVGYRLVVEDSAEMARFFVAETDAEVLLVDCPWNRSVDAEHPRIRRVHDWETIAAVIDDLE